MKNTSEWQLRIELKLLFLWVLMLSPALLKAQHRAMVSEEEVQSLKKSEKDLWYVDRRFVFEDKKSKPKEGEQRKVTRNEPVNFSINPAVGELFKYFAWLVAIVAIGGAVYLISKNLGGFQIKANEEVGEMISERTQIDSEEELGKIAYERQISIALQQNNYRLAVRLYYLWTLQKFSQAGLIDFHAHKTNLDYCQEIKSNEILPLFQKCTRFYDYVWFGNFNINQNAFATIETTFKELLKEKV